MRFFACSFQYVIIRYFLMMAAVIAGLFSGQPLIAFLALPLFLSAVTGVSFLPEVPQPAAKAKSIALDSAVRKSRKAA